MKTSNYLLFPLIAVYAMLIVSCEKTMDAGTQNSTSLNAEQTDDLFNANSCLITHYQDNYLLYSFDVSYNDRGEPDTVHLTSLGAQVAAVYNKSGRLDTITFPDPGLQQYWLLQYDGWRLPAKMLLIVTNYKDYGQTDSVNVAVRFKYNDKGELVQMKQANIWFPGNDITYVYKYDGNENVTSIMHIPETGTPYLEYAFTGYDHKPNFITGSKWMRYLLLDVGFDPFYQLLFSKNNAKDWTWFNAFHVSGADEIVTSTFAYNSEGFANTVNLNVTDPVFGPFTGTRNAVSTCDNFAIAPITGSSARPNVPFNNFKEFNKTALSPMRR
jgi:hypothetical protein